jgi:hypothetical protein
VQEKPFVYSSPFDTLLDLTTNVLVQTQPKTEFKLIANNKRNTKSTK